MNENTTQLLEKIADSLGITTEYLWGVLINQAPIYAATTTIQIVLIIVATIVYSKFLSRHIKSANNYPSGDDVFFGKSLVLGITGAVLMILVVIALFAIKYVLYGFFNPEYWALNKILETLNQ